MVKLNIQFFGGRGASAGGTTITGNSIENMVNTELHTIHGESINRIVAPNTRVAEASIDRASFQQIQNTNWSYDPSKDSPSKMTHYDEEVMAVRMGDKTASVEVGHRILGDGTELYSVEAPTSTMDRLGYHYTNGRSKTRSGYLFNDKSGAELAARRALKAEINK